MDHDRCRLAERQQVEVVGWQGRLEGQEAGVELRVEWDGG